MPNKLVHSSQHQSNSEIHSDKTHEKSEIYNEDSKIKLIKKAFIDTVLSSTSHGIPNIFRSNKTFFKVMWTILFILCFAVCCLSILVSVITYLKWDVVTSIDYISEIPTKFPAISLCNLNPFITDYAINLTTNIFIAQKLFSLMSLSPTIRDINVNSIINQNLIHSNLLTTSYTDDQRKQLSYPIEYMLLYCQFSLKDCNASDFDWFYDPSYGNCFTFNSGRNSKNEKVNIMESTEPGSIRGLKLWLYIGYLNSYPSVFSSGIHVFAYNQTLSSKPRTAEGIDVSSGTHTNVIIKRVFDENLPSPFNDCKLKLNSIESSDSDLTKMIINSGQTYSQKECFDLCLQYFIIDNCKCYATYYNKLNGTIPCAEWDQINCIQKKTEEFQLSDFTQKCLPTCPPECLTVSYSLSTSFSDFPKQNTSDVVKNNLINMKYFDNITDQQIKKSLVSVNFYYDDLRYTQMSQSQLMTFVDLISNVGGTFGLFIGISFLSLAEIFELIFQIIFILFEKRNNILVTPIQSEN